MSYIHNMVASQLVNSKSSTITSINETLLTINPTDFYLRDVDGKQIKVSKELYDALENQRQALNKASATTQRSAMNGSVRQMFGINLD